MQPAREGSWASSLAVRKTMQGNRRRDTVPELAVRRLVHAAGLRYLVDSKPQPLLNRRADLVFRGGGPIGVIAQALTIRPVTRGE